MATADQIQPLESPAFDYELRLYVGGKYGKANLDAIQVGAAYSPTVQTTLSADVDPSSTAISVVSTTGFSTGSFLIHPAADRPQEEYEIVSYATKTSIEFSALERGDMKTEYSGAHISGAVVWEWVEVTNKIFDITSLEIEDQNSIVDWRATAVGTGYDSVLLSNDTAILCMWRFSPADGVAGTWTAWSVGFLGYIREADLTDTYRQEKGFRLNIGGLGMYVASTEMNAHHFGRTDLAAGKSVTVSSVLDDPAQEATSGEFVGSPEFGGDNLVDGDVGTLWISDGEPSLTPDSPLASYFSVNEVYLKPEPGYLAADYQWVEIHYKAGDKDRQMQNYALVSSGTEWKTMIWRNLAGEIVGDARTPANNFVLLEKVKMMSDDGSFAIVCSNLPSFLERWSAHGASYVLDWRQLMVGDFTLDPTGDFVAIVYVNHTESIVWWDGGRADWALYNYTNEDGAGPNWTGPMVDVTGTPGGHSIRRSPTGAKNDPDVATNWVADEAHPTPGAYLTGAPEWAVIDLDEMGITLAATLAIDETGEAELTGTLGITEGPGYVQIDSEIIKYETRDDANNKLLTLTRGQYATTPAEHPGPPSGSDVAQYENGASTLSHQISSITMRRRPVIASGTNYPNVPSFFEIFTTELVSPITPDSGDWDDDWELYWTRRMVEPVNYDTFWQRTFEPIRARKVLFTFHEMTDKGRVKLNEIHIYAEQISAESGDGTSSIFDGRYSGHVVQHLLTSEVGLDPALFTLTDKGRQFDELDLAKGKVDRVIRDLCKRSGCQLVFALDHTVEHRFDPLYPLAVLPAVEVEFDRGNVRKPEVSVSYAHNVSQVIFRATDPATDELYEVSYPDTPLLLGSPVEIDGYMIGSSDEAKLMADRIFHQRNSRLKATVTTVGPAEWLRPGMRCTVTWDMDEEGALLNGHNFVISSVHYRLKLGGVSGGSRSTKGMGHVHPAETTGFLGLG